MKKIYRNHYIDREVTRLVDNKTTYTTNFGELNMLETFHSVQNFAAQTDSPLLSCMIAGKKHVSVANGEKFDFLPGHSLILSSKEKMLIDFPTASFDNPTQCLTFNFAPEKISEVLTLLNENTHVNGDDYKWCFDETSVRLSNCPDFQDLLERFAKTFMSSNPAKDVFLELMGKELIIRLLQTKARSILLQDSGHALKDTRIAFVIDYINKHLTDPLNVDILAQKACMSTSHFFKVFKNVLGVAPIDYINQKRIKLSKKMLLESSRQVKDVAFLSGFNNISYFNRQFKKNEGVSPAAFRQQYRSI